MDTTHPLTRFGSHVVALLVAPVLAVISMLAYMFLAESLLADRDPSMDAFLCVAAAGWMVGGLLINRRYAESGPILSCAGAALAWWLMVGWTSPGPAAHGLYEFQMGCLGGAIASLFMLRATKKGLSLTVGLAVAFAVVGPVLVLQFRPVGDRMRITNAADRTEWVYVAHDERWYRGITYVQREPSWFEERGDGPELVQLFEKVYGMPYRLKRVVDPYELELAHEAFRSTEAKVLDRNMGWGRGAPFPNVFEWFRGDRYCDSIWTAEPVKRW